MQTYISILRGINVSGQKMIKMDLLKKLYEDLGFVKVTTYIQSGNVIFQDRETDRRILGKRISDKIREVFDFEVPVQVVTLEMLAHIFNSNPFVNQQDKDISFLHVTFFADVPDTARVEKMTGDFGPDEFIFGESAVYLFCPQGYGRTKLSNSFFENKLKVTATTRNWKTVTELYNLAAGLKS